MVTRNSTTPHDEPAVHEPGASARRPGKAKVTKANGKRKAPKAKKAKANGERSGAMLLALAVKHLDVEPEKFVTLARVKGIKEGADSHVRAVFAFTKRAIAAYKAR